MRRRVLTAFAAIVAASVLGQPAFAVTTYGVPVTSLNPLGSPVPIGGGNEMTFYIPLEDEETFGVNGGGMTQDTCWNPNGCVGGLLHINLLYTPVYPLPPNDSIVVNMLFTDLDLIGQSDPAHFFEALNFYDQNQNLLASIDSLADSGGPITIQAIPNLDQILIQVALDNITDPFLAELVLASSSDQTYAYSYYTWEYEWVYVNGQWKKEWEKVWHTAVHGGIDKKSKNTIEKLTTWIDSQPSEIPLPATLPLFVSAVAGIGLIGWRRRRAARS